MASLETFLKNCLVVPGTKVRLADHDPAWSGSDDKPKAERHKQAEEVLTQDVAHLTEAQDLLHASDTWSVLIILQAMDAAGKDSTIKHVMSGINPQGCQVHCFQQPSSEELEHDFLWRCSKVLPQRGQIGIFNRSYYEDVLVTRVHPELIGSGQAEKAKREKFWRHRYKDINHFERHLTHCSTKIIKFFLNVSRGEQAKRLLDRASRPDKHWKFSLADMAERSRWSDYLQAYEACLSATSTKWAPWYIVPADHKWITRALVASIITTEVHSLGLEYPQLSQERSRQIEAAKRELELELAGHDQERADA